MTSVNKRTSLFRIITLSLIAILTIAVLALAAVNIFQESENADASFSDTDCVGLKMQPGATCRFRISYQNGEGAITTNSVLTILIGDQLIIDENSFEDEMKVDGVSQGVFPVDFNAVSLDNTGGWGARLSYYPGSANDPNNPSGIRQGGELPANTIGFITFSAQLNPNILNEGYSVGDVLQPPSPLDFSQQGIFSVLNTNETPNPLSGQVAIKIIAPDVISSSATDTSSEASSSSENRNIGAITGGELTGQQGLDAQGAIQFDNTTTYIGSATYTNGAGCSIDGVIAQNNGTFEFTPTPGEIVDPGCSLGSNTNGQIIANNQTIPNAPSNFTPGSVFSSSSDANSSDQSSSDFSLSSDANSSAQNSSNSGDTAGNCDGIFSNNCRLYFIGADNAAVNFDTITQSNLNYDKLQRRAEGNVTIVFDNIKLQNGIEITNGSSCTFEIGRYADDFGSVITKDSTTTNGRTEVILPTEQQNLNYYNVVSRCTDLATSEIVEDYDRLVLVKSAEGVREVSNDQTIEL